MISVGCRKSFMRANTIYIKKGNFMKKIIGKELPWEQQREMLITTAALKLPLLYQTLTAAYGEEKGRQIYDELYEANYKKRLPQFKDKTIVDVIAAEIDIFPAFGWEMWMETDKEGGVIICYEHLVRCPHLEATRKYKLPDPCSILCELDCRMSAKYKLGVWERVSHLPSGDTECCFKIKPWHG